MPQVKLPAAVKAEEDGGNYNNGVIGNKENFNIFRLCGSRKN